MEEKQTASKFFSTVITAAAVIIILAALKQATSIVVPFLLASFIALLCTPLLFWLRAKKVPNGLSVLLVLLVLVTIGGALGITVGSSLKKFSQELPTYQHSLETQTEALLLKLDAQGIDTASYKESIADMANPSSAMGMAASTLKGVSSLLTNGFMILLTVVFILLEAVGMPGKMNKVLDDPARVFQGFSIFVESLKKYIVIKTLISAATGVFVTIWLAIIGVDFPILWGLVAFAFNFVPTIGSIIAAVPAVLLGIVQLGPSAILSVGSCYLTINIVMGNIIEPKIMGDNVGLSTLVVFLSLIFWGWLLGPVGMLLSIPLTMVIKIACLSSRHYKHIGILLGPGGTAKAPEDPPAAASEKSKA